LLFFVSFWVSPLLSNFTLENCSTKVPAGNNNPQPAIVMLNFTENYTTYELPASSGARCLDGTNYKFYFTEGSGGSSNKWIFYWQGAAFCGSDGYEPIESCYQRMSTSYGTSNSSYWGDNGTVTMAPAAMGWFSSMKEYNPKFYNWNKVELISCDGANHQGAIEEPYYYKGTYLYFRGMNNTLATIEFLENYHGLSNATEILFGGGSSGATASYIWSSYLQDYFPKSVRLTGVPDAGLFVDSYSENNHCYLYRFFMQTLSNALNLSNSTSSILYRRCKYRNSDEFWKCLMVEYIYDSIDIPMFIINSQNDFKQLTNLISLGCINYGGLTYCDSDDRRKITNVREKFLRVVMKIKKEKPQWGFWLRTCFEHTYHFTWGWYGHEMDVFSAELFKASNIRDALYSWYENAGEDRSAASFIDVIDWLHNPMCHYGPNQYDQVT